MLHECFHCETELAARDSKFCSPACREGYAKTMAETISCNHCFAESDGLAASVAAGWTRLEPDPEGSTWNYRGTCPDPECVAEQLAE